MYAYCAKCKDYIEYEILGDITNFPRGEYLAHQDYITTGFKTFEDALRWYREYDWKNDPYNIVPK